MSIYMTAKEGTPAYVLGNQYLKSTAARRDALAAMLKAEGFDSKGLYTNEQGSVAAVKLDNQPDEWIRPRNCGVRAFFPKRIKKNMALLKRIAEFKLYGSVSVAETLFGGSVLHFEGLGICRGVSLSGNPERIIIGFAAEGHLLAYKDNKELVWPRGLRKVAASTVTKWIEQQDKEA